MIIKSLIAVILVSCTLLLVRNCAHQPPVSSFIGSRNFQGMLFHEVAIQCRDGESRLSVGHKEVSNGEFCQFLNEIKYAVARARVKNFEVSIVDAKLAEKPADYTEVIPSIYLIEFAGATIQRNQNHFTTALTSSSDEAANCITYFGAAAYCDWFSKKFNVNARLPTELEWQTSADTLSRSKIEVIGLPGGVWEWCSDWYNRDHPFEHRDDYQGASKPDYESSPKRVIRGGTWSNRARATRDSRAAFTLLGGGEGEQSIGFRMIIEVAENH